MSININTYETRLKALLVELETELSTIGIHSPENPNDWIAKPEGVAIQESDSNVSADRVEEWEERRSTVATLETRYNNLKRALKKIEDGTYGICEICGDEIEEDRLNANPAARTNKAHIEEETNLPM